MTAEERNEVEGAEGCGNEIIARNESKASDKKVISVKSV